MRDFFALSGGFGYISLWNKYRPAIIKLMKGAETSPQEYKLFGHEFKGLNPNERKGHVFTLQVYKGKAENNIKLFLAAQDLLQVLVASKTASDLMEKNHYEISMNKHFVLQVKKIEVEEVPSESL
jgi:hypothetical protein